MPRSKSRKSEPKRKKLPIEHARSVVRRLKKLYPEADCALTHQDPFQLLVATILSAQCTDDRVNKVTPPLFERFPGPKEFAGADIREIEEMIRSTGFFRNKAKSILNASRDILRKHGGKVPDTMEELVRLAGVGRKTANVVLGNAFGKNEGVVVDTHVGRLSRRLGLTDQEDPKKVELDLMERIPKKDWALFAHLMIWHGRKVCKSQNPKCPQCQLAPICPSAQL